MRDAALSGRWLGAPSNSSWLGAVLSLLTLMTLSCVRPAHIAAGVAATGTAGASSSAAQPPTPEEEPAAPETPGSPPAPEARGTLVARVQIRQLGGAPPAPGVDAGSREITSPAQGATVAVLAADPPQPLVDEQPVDSSGEVVFSLPAGRYVVVVVKSQASSFPGAIVVSDRLPDGRSVFARQEVTLSVEPTREITLSIVVPLP